MERHLTSLSVSCYKEATRAENDSLMIEASRSRIKARGARRELEDQKEKYVILEKDLRGELEIAKDENKKSMEEKDKRTHTLCQQLEEFKNRNQFLESKNEDLENALESDAGAYYGAQLQKITEAHDVMMSRANEDLKKLTADLRLEKEKATESKKELENVKKAMFLRNSKNKKDSEVEWVNALGLNDIGNQNDEQSVSSNAADKRQLKLKQMRIEKQDTLLRSAQNEIGELRDLNRRLVEHQTSLSVSLLRRDSSQGGRFSYASPASSRQLSRTNSRNSSNFITTSSNGNNSDEREEMLSSSEKVKAPLSLTAFYYMSSPKKGAETLRRTDSTVSPRLRITDEETNVDVNLAALGSWASFDLTEDVNTMVEK